MTEVTFTQPTQLKQPTQLQHILAHQAAAHADSVALWWQGAAISYATLQHNSAATAARLAAVGASGDRVADGGQEIGRAHV